VSQEVGKVVEVSGKSDHGKVVDQAIETV